MFFALKPILKQNGNIRVEGKTYKIKWEWKGLNCTATFVDKRPIKVN